MIILNQVLLQRLFMSLQNICNVKGMSSNTSKFQFFFKRILLHTSC